MRSFPLVSVLGLASALGCFAAQAESVSATLDVIATAVPKCSVSTSVIAFGPRTEVGSNAGGTVFVTCVNNLPYSIAIDAGQNYDGVSRRMAGKTNNGFLKYSLYTDYVAPRDAWGDTGFGGTFPAAAVAKVGSGARQPTDVWGEITGGNGTAGEFADRLIVTIHY